MKFAFITCVELGLACMREIYHCGGHLDLVITLKDDIAVNKSGRVWIDDFCHKENIDILKITNINEPIVFDEIKRREIEYLFIIGWSQIASPLLLRAPKQGVLGMHPTLLPEGRGRAAIPWAILKGLKETGVTLFILNEGVDTGPILYQEKISVEPRETATTLYEKINYAHILLIRRVWENLLNNQLVPIEQDNSKATEWPARMPADGLIRTEMTVEHVDRLVRAVTHPYPGAFYYEDPQTLIRVWQGSIVSSDVKPSSGAKFLRLSDGIYLVEVYDTERLHSASIKSNISK
ncbi:MAG: hypothetical protein LLG02_10175 [Pelosinus sp.]|nr:hypothetical protein [Pelosinus sp.]